MTGVNDRIKELRIELKMTQEDFGNRIGLSKSGISNIENGARGIRERHIKLICSMFNVSEAWLKTGEGPIAKLAASSKQINNFINFLTSIDYKVELTAAPLFMSSSTNEEQLILDAEGAKEEATRQGNDQSNNWIILTKGKISVSFSISEFEDFINTISKAIEFEIFRTEQIEK